MKGRGPADVTELSVTLASQMLVVAGIAADETSARARVAEVIASGAALDKFRAVIARQGGDASVVDDYARLPSTAAREDVTAVRSGFIVGIDAERIGRASMLLGAGRERWTRPSTTAPAS